MKRLIVNADDFGLHTEVNKAVIKGYQAGCIRSTSLMPTGAAVEEACELARKNPGLGVGIHLTLVAERPLLPPDKVPTLVGADGRLFRNHVEFIKNFCLGKIDKEQLYAECDAQISKAVSLGLNITHIDSHQHLHVLPGVAAICRDLARKYGVTKMRFPGEGYGFIGGYSTELFRFVARCGLTLCADMARYKSKCYNIGMPGHFFGMLAGENMQEEYFMNILRSLPDGVSEIMVHPGADNKALDSCYDWQYHWEDELATVISPQVMRYIKDNDIKLISFKELLNE